MPSPFSPARQSQSQTRYHGPGIGYRQSRAPAKEKEPEETDPELIRAAKVKKAKSTGAFAVIQGRYNQAAKPHGKVMDDEGNITGLDSAPELPIFVKGENGRYKQVGTTKGTTTPAAPQDIEAQRKEAIISKYAKGQMLSDDAREEAGLPDTPRMSSADIAAAKARKEQAEIIAAQEDEQARTRAAVLDTTKARQAAQTASDKALSNSLKTKLMLAERELAPLESAAKAAQKDLTLPPPDQATLKAARSRRDALMKDVGAADETTLASTLKLQKQLEAHAAEEEKVSAYRSGINRRKAMREAGIEVQEDPLWSTDAATASKSSQQGRESVTTTPPASTAPSTLKNADQDNEIGVAKNNDGDLLEAGDPVKLTASRLMQSRKAMVEQSPVSDPNERHYALADVEARIADPAKWEAAQYIALEKQSDEELSQRLQAMPEVLAHGQQIIAQTNAAAQQELAATQHRMDKLVEDNRKLMERTFTMDTTTEIPGQGRWHNANLMLKDSLTKKFQKIQDDANAAIAIDQRELERDLRVAKAREDELNRRRTAGNEKLAGEQEQGFRDMAAQGQSGYAEELRVLHKERKDRIDNIDPFIPRGTDEYAAAVDAVNEDVGGKFKTAQEKADKTSTAATELYEQWGKGLSYDWSDPKATDSIHERMVKEGKDRGLNEADTRYWLTSMAQADWSKPSRIGDGDSPLRETADPAKQEYRVLPNGNITVNPAHLLDKDEYERIVQSSPVTAAAKKHALEVRAQLAPELAVKAIESLRGNSEMGEWLDENTSGSDLERMEQFTSKMKAGGWTTAALYRFTSAIDAIGQSWTGAAHAVTGSDTFAQADVPSLLSADYWQKRTEANETAASTAEKGTGIVGKYAAMVIGGIPSVAESLTTGAAAGALYKSFKVAAGAAKLAQAGVKIKKGADAGQAANLAARVGGMSDKTLQAVQMTGAALDSAIQQGGQTYLDAYDTYLKEELGGTSDPEEAKNRARLRALAPAVLDGAQTAILTALGGAQGVQAVFRKAAVNGMAQAERKGLVAAINRGLKTKLGTLGMDFGEEAIEEFSNQAISGMIAKASYNPSLTTEQLFSSAFDAGIVGGILGGAMGSGKLLSDSRSDEPGAKSATTTPPTAPAPASMAPETEAAIATAIDGYRGEAFHTPEDIEHTKELASAIIKVSTGEQLKNLPSSELRALGYEYNAGEIKPIKGQQQYVQDRSGKLVITQAGIDHIHAAIPATKAASIKSEQERLDEINQPPQGAGQTAAPASPPVGPVLGATAPDTASTTRNPSFASLSDEALNDRFEQAVRLSNEPGRSDSATWAYDARLMAKEIEARKAAKPVDTAAHEAATSPTNDLSEPTLGQINANNYKLGKPVIGGVHFRIENPAGSTRKDKETGGKKWKRTMDGVHYGYIAKTEGHDGDPIDAFLREGMDESWDGDVFIIDQHDPKTGLFDEHKVMVGFSSMSEARDAYLAQYEEGWQGLKKIAAMPLSGLAAMVKSGKLNKSPTSKTDASQQGTAATTTPPSPNRKMGGDESAQPPQKTTPAADRSSDVQGRVADQTPDASLAAIEQQMDAYIASITNPSRKVDAIYLKGQIIKAFRPYILAGLWSKVRISDIGPKHKLANEVGIGVGVDVRDKSTFSIHPQILLHELTKLAGTEGRAKADTTIKHAPFHELAHTLDPNTDQEAASLWRLVSEDTQRDFANSYFQGSPAAERAKMVDEWVNNPASHTYAGREYYRAQLEKLLLGEISEEVMTNRNLAEALYAMILKLAKAINDFAATLKDKSLARQIEHEMNLAAARFLARLPAEVQADLRAKAANEGRVLPQQMPPPAKPTKGMSRDDFNRGMAAKVKEASAQGGMLPKASTTPMPGILPGGDSSVPEAPTKEYNEAVVLLRESLGGSLSLIDLQRVHSDIAAGESIKEAVASAILERKAHDAASDAVTEALKSGSIESGVQAQNLYDRVYVSQKQTTPATASQADSGEGGGIVRREAAGGSIQTVDGPKVPNNTAKSKKKEADVQAMSKPAMAAIEAEWAEEQAEAAEEEREPDMADFIRRRLGMAEEAFPTIYTEDFGDPEKFTGSAFHQTDLENVEDIIKTGLKPSYGTGIENRGTWGVFTAAEEDPMNTYGDITVEINVGAVKRANPDISTGLEGPIEDQLRLEAVAHSLGMDGQDIERAGFGPESSYGIQHNTLVIRGTVEPRFIRITNKKGDVLHEGEAFGAAPKSRITVHAMGKPASAKQVARHTALEAKHNAGTITPEETAEAQALVEAVAKKAGYDVGPVWHGTKSSEDFNVFKQSSWQGKAMFFSSSEKSIPHLTGGDRRVLGPFYLRMESPLSEKEWRRFVSNPPMFNTEGKDGFVRGKEIAVFNPNQIKSADPFTGIPLDQRFNPASDSILQMSKPASELDGEYAKAVADGDMAKAQRMVDAAAKATGYDIKAYHGGIEKITAFDEGYAGLTTADNEHGAFYFSDKKEVADDYRRQAFIRRYQDNPIGLVEDGLITQEKFDELEGSGVDWYAYVDESAEENGNLVSAYLKMERPLVIDAKGKNLRDLEKAFNVQDAIGFLKGKQVDEIPEELYESMSYTKEQIDDYREEIEAKAREDNMLEPDEAIEEWMLADAAREVLQDNGIEQELPDSIIIRHVIDDIGEQSNTNQDVHIVIDPTAIKSADPVTRDAEGNVIPLSARFNSESNSILYMGKPAAAPFYSKLSRLIESKMQARADATSIKGLVSNPQNGIKAEELKWSGIMPWLDSQPAPITKQAVLDYLATDGAVRLEEVELSADYPFVKQTKNGWAVVSPTGKVLLKAGKLADAEAFVKAHKPLGAKFSQYQLPGGENYREVVLAMPETGRSAKEKLHDEVDTEYRLHGNSERYLELTRQLRIATNGLGVSNYTSSHFPDVPNYVAHMRLNDRTDAEGKPGLFIEEIQSDRGQAGREHGFLLDAGETKRLQELNDKWNGSNRGPEDVLIGSEYAEWEALANAHDASLMSGKAVPSMPFSKTWPLQMFKRALADAVTGGKDWIGWTMGIDQVKRYTDALRQVVDRISWVGYDQQPNSTFESEESSIKEVNSAQESIYDAYNAGSITRDERNAKLAALDETKDAIRKQREARINAGQKLVRAEKGGEVVFSGHVDKDGVFLDGVARGQPVGDVLGKEVAAKVKSDVAGDLKGDNLTVGGEGMKGFYDDILPKEVGKYVKQWGSAVEKSLIKTNDHNKPFGEATPIWRVDINKAMRDGVAAGQTLFMGKPASGQESDPPTASPKEQLDAVRRKYEGKPTWHKAPNGKDSKLTIDQWLIVRTPNFKRWFGDWEKFANGKDGGGVWSDASGEVSKIVDENGEPRVMYHGSQKAGFTEFDMDEAPRGSRPPSAFFSSQNDVARTYSGTRDLADTEVDDSQDDNIKSEASVRSFSSGYEVFVGEDTYRFEKDAFATIEDEDERDEKLIDAAMAQWIAAGRPGTKVEPHRGNYAVFLNVRNPHEEYFEGANWDGQRGDMYIVREEDSDDSDQIYDEDGKGYFDKYDADKLAAKHPNATVFPADDHYTTTNGAAFDAHRSGNDGAYLHDVVDDGAQHTTYDTSDVVVVFSPNQIKDANRNSGAFSAKDNSILFMARPSQAQQEAIDAGTIDLSKSPPPTDPGHIRNAKYIPKRGLQKNNQLPYVQAFYKSNSLRAKAGRILRSFERDWKPFFTFIDDLAPREERKKALHKIISRFALDTTSPESVALWNAYADLKPDQLVPEDTERVAEAKELLPYLEGLSIQAMGRPASAAKSRIPAGERLNEKMLAWAQDAWEKRNALAADIRAITLPESPIKTVSDWLEHTRERIADAASTGHLEGWAIEPDELNPVYRADWSKHVAEFVKASVALSDKVKEVTGERIEYGNARNLSHQPWQPPLASPDLDFEAGTSPLQGREAGSAQGQEASTVAEPASITPAQDAEYAKAVADGDMETAQRMVDEAAKKAGLVKLTFLEDSVPSGYYRPTTHKLSSLRMMEDATRKSERGEWDEFLEWVNGDVPLDMEPIVTTEYEDEPGVFYVNDGNHRVRAWQNEFDMPGSTIIPALTYTDSLDLVFEDEAGNVIPLSARFNSESNSILYMSKPAGSEIPRVTFFEGRWGRTEVIKNASKKEQRGMFSDGSVGFVATPENGEVFYFDRSKSYHQGVINAIGIERVPHISGLLYDGGVLVTDATSYEYDSSPAGAEALLKLFPIQAGRELTYYNDAIVGPWDELSWRPAQGMGRPAGDAGDQALNRIARSLPSNQELDVLDSAASESFPEMSDEQRDGAMMRAMQKTQTDPDTVKGWHRAAKRMIAADRQGVIDEVTNNFYEGRSFGSPELAMAASILSSELLKEATLSGNEDLMRRARAFNYAAGAGETQAGRELRALNNPYKSNREKVGEMIAALFSTPPERIRAKIAAAPSPNAKAKRIAELKARIKELEQQIIAGDMSKGVASAKAKAELKRAEAEQDKAELVDEALAKREKKIKAALKDEGLTVEDILVTPEDRVAAQDSELVKNARAKHKPDEQVALQFIGLGYSDADIAKLTGKDRGAIATLREDYRNRSLKPEVAQAVKKNRTIMDVIRDGFKKVFGVLQMAKPAVAWNSVQRIQPAPKPVRPVRGLKPTKVIDTVAQKIDIMLNALAPTSTAANNGSLKAVVVDGKKGQKVTVHVPFDPDDFKSVYKLARSLSIAEASGFDKAYEFWINNLLSGPQTNIVNIIGNTLSTALHFGIQRPLETIANLGGLVDEKSAQLGEWQYIAGAFLSSKSWREALTMGILAYSAEADPTAHRYLDEPMQIGFSPTGDAEKIGGYRGPSVKGFKGRVIRIPGRLLRMMDAIFKSFIMHAEVGAQAYRIAKAAQRRGLIGKTGAELQAHIQQQIDTKGSLAWKLSMGVATDLTFQDENWMTDLAKFVTQGADARVKHRQLEAAKSRADGDIEAAHHLESRANIMAFTAKLMRIIFPFVRTPTNILRMGVRKSPLGSLLLAGYVLQMFRQGITNKINGRDFLDGYPKGVLIKLIAEQALAWAVTAALFRSAEGDDDDDKKKFIIVGGRPWKDAGAKDAAYRDYGGTYMLIWRDKNGKETRIPFGRYEPVATLLGTTIDSIRHFKARALREKNGEAGADYATVFKAIMGDTMNQAGDKSFLKGISSLVRELEHLQDSGTLTTGLDELAWKSALTAIIPNLIRQPMRNMDDKVRDSKKKNTWYDAFPMGTNAEPVIDVFGEDADKGGNMLSRILFPTANAQKEQHPLTPLLHEWNSENQDDKIQPVPLNRSGFYTYGPDGKTKVQLTNPKQKAEFQHQVGAVFSERAKVLVANIKARGGKLPDNFKKIVADVLADARTDVRKAAGRSAFQIAKQK